MAWTRQQRADIIGAVNPDPMHGFMGEADPPPLPSWPVRPPEDMSDGILDGVRLVSEYLRDGLTNDLIVSGLHILEAELKARLQKSEHDNGWSLLDGAAPSFDSYQAALPAVGAKDDPRRAFLRHLLSQTLLDALGDNGFNLSTPDQRIPLGILPSDEFFGPIRQRMHVKDVLVGLEHGEWTHMLQWYLLAVSPPVATTPGYTFKAAEVFEYLGRQGAAQGAAAPEERPLWQFVCDRVSFVFQLPHVRGVDLGDYRCPDHLHVDLAGICQSRSNFMWRLFGGTPVEATLVEWSRRCIDHGKKWPLLCALLERRLLSRERLYLQAEQWQRLVVERVAATVKTELQASYFSAKIDFANSDFVKFVKIENIFDEVITKAVPATENWKSLVRFGSFNLTQHQRVFDIVRDAWAPELHHLQERAVRSLLYVWSKSKVTPSWQPLAHDTDNSWRTGVSPGVQAVLLSASQQGFWNDNKLRAELASV